MVINPSFPTQLHHILLFVPRLLKRPSRVHDGNQIPTHSIRSLILVSILEMGRAPNLGLVQHVFVTPYLAPNRLWLTNIMYASFRAASVHWGMLVANTDPPLQSALERLSMNDPKPSDR
jgi:hypothetical protein